MQKSIDLDLKLKIVNFCLACDLLHAEAGLMCHFSDGGGCKNVKFLCLAVFLRKFKC